MALPLTIARPVFQYDVADMPRYLEILKTRLRIAVVYGGDNSHKNAVIHRTHNPRPWKSYEAVARDIRGALQQAGFDYVTLMPDDMTLPQRLKEEGIDLAWLNTGGVQGYDSISHTAAMLEMMGMPYIGHNPAHAALLDNKHLFKRQLQALGIPTAPFITWHPAQGTLATGSGSRFRQVFADDPGPFVIKPVSGRASLNVLVIDRVGDLPDAAYELADCTHNTVMIEAYLPGREYCMGVCGGVVYTAGEIEQQAQPFAFSAVERLLEAGEMIFTSMDFRSIDHNRLRRLHSVEPEYPALVELARAIYHEFSLQSLVRVDVRADAQGKLHVLEANPKPDLQRSLGLLTAGLSASGLDYTDLILSLLADRLHHLFRYTPDTVLHLVEMLM